MHQVLAQAFKLIKSSNVGKFVQCMYSFIHSDELKIVQFYYVSIIWWSELKIHSEQGQVKLGLKANVEFKIQTQIP